MEVTSKQTFKNVKTSQKSSWYIPKNWTLIVLVHDIVTDALSIKLNELYFQSD